MPIRGSEDEGKGREEGEGEATQSGVLVRSIAQEPPGDGAGCRTGESSMEEKNREFICPALSCLWSLIR